MIVPSGSSSSLQESCIYHTGAHRTEALSHQKRWHWVAWLDIIKRLLDVFRTWFLQVDLQLCIPTLHRGKALSPLTMRVIKPTLWKINALFVFCSVLLQRWFHTAEAHRPETSDNVSQSISVPETSMLFILFFSDETWCLGVSFVTCWVMFFFFFCGTWVSFSLDTERVVQQVL